MKNKYLIYVIIILIQFLFVNNLFSQCDDDCSKCPYAKKEQAEAKTKASNAKIADANNSKDKTNDDEFLPYDSSKSKDEFEDYTATKPNDSSKAVSNSFFSDSNRMLYIPIIGLLATLLAGIFFRFKPTRKVKGIFLVSSIVFFGFYNGACPCPISSFSNVLIAIFGGGVHWKLMFWFLGLIPITYIFGKVWCGWVCHLGALQEFLYINDKLKFLQGKNARLVMNILRWFFFGLLIVQLIFTKSYLFVEYDPFRVAYNLGMGANTVSWILLGLTLLSSLFIYRPFCKSACPIGLVLGWVSKIPGASLIGRKNEDCTGCRLCSESCKMDAIVREDKISVLQNKDCIGCGECLDTCKSNSLSLLRNSKANTERLILRRD